MAWKIGESDTAMGMAFKNLQLAKPKQVEKEIEPPRRRLVRGTQRIGEWSDMVLDFEPTKPPVELAQAILNKVAQRQQEKVDIRKKQRIDVDPEWVTESELELTPIERVVFRAFGDFWDGEIGMGQNSLGRLAMRAC